jgi:surfeit locus 1 family protein
VLVALLASFVSLGFWQLGRADEKRSLAEAFAAGSTRATLTALPARADAAPYATAVLSGRYDNSRQILLDAMTYRGEAGYQVLTPFQPLGGSRWLLVNRGWVGAGPERSVLPVVTVTEDRRNVIGRIAELPRPGLRLGVAKPLLRDGVEVRLFPTVADLERDLDRPLFPYQLWLEPDEPDGFVRDWHLGGLSAAQHVAYAVQWFALAALVGAAGTWLMVRYVLGLRPP